MLERGDGEVTLADQADLLSMSRSSLYYVPRAPSEEEVRIKHRIDVLYTELPFYGSRRLLNALREEGFDIRAHPSFLPTPRQHPWIQQELFQCREPL